MRVYGLFPWDMGRLKPDELERIIEEMRVMKKAQEQERRGG